jgi:hypothetical protein
MPGGRMPIVPDNIDTLILNAKLRQDSPLEVAQQLEVLKEASQDTEKDIVTDYTFAGERLCLLCRTLPPRAQRARVRCSWQCVAAQASPRCASAAVDLAPRSVPPARKHSASRMRTGSDAPRSRGRV